MAAVWVPCQHCQRATDTGRPGGRTCRLAACALFSASGQERGSELTVPGHVPQNVRRGQRTSPRSNRPQTPEDVFHLFRRRDAPLSLPAEQPPRKQAMQK